VDQVAFDSELKNVCFRCGSTPIVSSILSPDISGWVCKHCRDGMRGQRLEGNVLFGDEFFLNDDLTIYDQWKSLKRLLSLTRCFKTRIAAHGYYPTMNSTAAW
jgi:hypothetical protein